MGKITGARNRIRNHTTALQSKTKIVRLSAAPGFLAAGKTISVPRLVVLTSIREPTGW
jgi:hypothetical protein